MLSAGINDTRLKHEKYQMNLTDWNKFIIWIYTVGSSAVNGYLFGQEDLRVMKMWCTRFRQLLMETSSSMSYTLPKPWKRFQRFLSGGADLTPEEVRRFIALYSENLSLVIAEAPPTTAEFTVYKSSSPYPGLEVGSVKQLAFNSSSYRVDMNYSIFLPPDGLCCMHKIRVPKGSHVLVLSPLLSAYPDEAEVLLPPNVSFEVFSTSFMKVSFNKTAVKWKEAQKLPRTVGPLYLYDYKADCDAKEKQVKLYNSVLRA